VELDQDGHPKKRLVTVETFQISKYPVTNAQFQAFVEDPNGYANPAWWHDSDAAIEWRKKNTQVKPSKFKGAERPREMVSWYEAIAFCNWFSASAGYKVILPATAQWQRAFQGEDGRPFPWGKAFDKNLCNTFESEIKMTTLVTRYSEGISPYGVYDMAGNVWEWCSDIVQTNDAKVADQKRIVRGGSFISPYQRAHVGFQYHLTPESYHASIGFRLARTR
jgi:formylglycine-generating enzyme required for sulfatase activity